MTSGQARACEVHGTSSRPPSPGAGGLLPERHQWVPGTESPLSSDEDSSVAGQTAPVRVCPNLPPLHPPLPATPELSHLGLEGSRHCLSPGGCGSFFSNHKAKRDMGHPGAPALGDLPSLCMLKTTNDPPSRPGRSPREPTASWVVDAAIAVRNEETRPSAVAGGLRLSWKGDPAGGDPLSLQRQSRTARQATSSRQGPAEAGQGVHCFPGGCWPLGIPGVPGKGTPPLQGGGPAHRGPELLTACQTEPVSGAPLGFLLLPN